MWFLICWCFDLFTGSCRRWAGGGGGGNVLGRMESGISRALLRSIVH